MVQIVKDFKIALIYFKSFCIPPSIFQLKIGEKRRSGKDGGVHDLPPTGKLPPPAASPAVHEQFAAGEPAAPSSTPANLTNWCIL